jgi:hypothetical protein
MAKTHWKEAPESIRRAIESARRDTTLVTPAGPVAVDAIGQLNALRMARRHGYAYDSINMPAHVAVRASDPTGAARLRTQLGFELKYEDIASRESAALERWRQEPSEAEIAEQRTAIRNRESAERALEQRTREIVAEQEKERTEKAVTAARAKARKEIDQQQQGSN